MQLQSLSGLLKDFRFAAGLTQETLAERAGVSARTVSDLERGLILSPHRDTVERLVEALALSADQQTLLEGVVSRARGPAPPAAFTAQADSAPNGTAHQPRALPTGLLTLLM